MNTQQTPLHLHEPATARRLRTLRRSQLATALRQAGEDRKVALYALVRDGQDPADRLAAARDEASL